MKEATATAPTNAAQHYLVSPGAAWFALIMTIGLMLFDYADRQILVSLFPFLKAAWHLSDKQLGVLVSAVSVTISLGGIPVALLADRTSRVKSIAAMAALWSFATASCMFARAFPQLLIGRLLVGVGEAGFGSAGAALITSHFPARMRGVVLAGFFASASVGSVLGVVLGGVIAARWGWQAAFGLVGGPGLLLAILYLFVRDYPTEQIEGKPSQSSSIAQTVASAAKSLVPLRTMRYVCVGAAAQLIVVSAIWAWLPSYLNRVGALSPVRAASWTGVVILIGAVGSLVWGAVIDHIGTSQPRRKLLALAALCVPTTLVLPVAFDPTDLSLSTVRCALIALGGLVMTCTVGPVAAIVMDVIHPSVRSTGASVLSLFQNLFGLAAGPLIAGALSDRWGLPWALTLTPAFSLVAAGAFILASRTYESELHRSPDRSMSTDGCVTRQHRAQEAS
jgi:MFS family permease